MCKIDVIKWIKMSLVTGLRIKSQVQQVLNNFETEIIILAAKSEMKNVALEKRCSAYTKLSNW